MKTLITQETSNDFSAVYTILEGAFGQSNESKLVELLRKSSDFIPELSLIAKVDNNIIGHILFTKIKIEDENGNEYDSLALAPMAIIPKLQKKGIGGKLIHYGLNKAKKLGYPSVIVLGHEHYYPKFGFMPTDKWNIKAPFPVPANVFMGIELQENGFEGVNGIVRYPKEFEMV